MTHCYMLVSNDSLELPIFVADTLYQLSLILGISYITVKSAYKRHSVIRKYNGFILRVAYELD